MEEAMSRVQQSIDVDVPVDVAYDQWTQFESFPRFMEGVKEVEQVDDKRLRWTAEVGGQERSWDAEIVDQTPNQRVAWKSVSGTDNAGAVQFKPLDGSRTRIDVTMEAEPEGVVEKAGDALGFLDRRVKGDLERFAEFIQRRGQPTGAWEGEIHGDKVRPDPDGPAR
jgi:uncharacterized membrane protein